MAVDSRAHRVGLHHYSSYLKKAIYDEVVISDRHAALSTD